ncbi:ferredoxin [Rhodococcus sp. NPDC056960]|uniref:ferredoxin n=1 Tax=Rhodococcus sp. NPDC056960 TaxID=3345982 RepID=UPI0036336C15
MKIKINKDLCCGAGQCVIEAPTVFDQDDEGIAFLLDQTPGESQRAEVEAAMAACPTVAIMFAEENS